MSRNAAVFKATWRFFTVCTHLLFSSFIVESKCACGRWRLGRAHQATDYALARLPQDEGVWRSALAALRKQPTGEAAEQLLRTLLEVFESGLRLVRSSRSLWLIAAQVGGAGERAEELARAEQRFAELAAEVNKSLAHRARNWQPADPERLALGLKLAREGKTVTVDEACAWFRRNQRVTV